MKRLLVWGLDGATFELLDSYIATNPQGFFGKCLSSGFSCPLKSTTPWFTAPAWATFMTGLNPGQHGLYHWRGRYAVDLKERPLLQSSHLEHTTLWSHAEQHGGRVAISNYPMQYPAPQLNGYCICGTLAPEDAVDQTWPRSLSETLRKEIPGFRFEMNKGISYGNQLELLREHILSLGRNHCASAEFLAKKGPFDLFVHVVTITDRIAHFFWHCHDQQHPKYDQELHEKLKDPILEAFQLAEESAERVWNSADWDNLIIVSDHGMGPSYWSFYTDLWLEQLGLLTFSEDGKVIIEESIAYSGEEPELCIYVNRTDREGFGVSPEKYPTLVNDLKQKILELSSPKLNGRKLFRQAFLQGEIYFGPSAAFGPDIVLWPEEGVHPCPNRGPELLTNSTRLFAGHRRDGIFIGYGKDFHHKEDRSLSLNMTLEDCFPLACALMDITVPKNLPGKIPQPFLDNKLTFSEAEIDWPSQVKLLPRHQPPNEEMLRKLRELGYL